MKAANKPNSGFTLIELSIVLVIIGLIVGGILVGRDLIKAAEIRATISQIEKYNTAANTFRGKYGYLPGDINAVAAAQFGFAARGSGPGEGDGNGVIEGVYNSTQAFGVCEGAGETSGFWVDLSAATLIDGGFNTAITGFFGNPPPLGPTQFPLYFPQAKLGQGNYVYVWSYNEINYYGISQIYGMGNPNDCSIDTNPGMSVMQAYNIDRKMDDGLPTTGNVIALDNNLGGGSWLGTASSSVAVAGSSLTCYDNNGSTSSPVVYSIKQSNGAGVNCALSFQFQ